MRLGNPQSFNRYAYVNNDPTNFVDPTGLLCYGDHVFYSFDGGKSWVYGGFIISYCDSDGPIGGDGNPIGGGGGDGSVLQGQVTSRCPPYNDLTPAQRGAIKQSKYEGLSDFQQAKFLNVTAAMSAAGIDYSGLDYDSENATQGVIFSATFSEDKARDERSVEIGRAHV